jgi:hypothetical protein
MFGIQFYFASLVSLTLFTRLEAIIFIRVVKLGIVTVFLHFCVVDFGALVKLAILYMHVYIPNLRLKFNLLF